MRNKKKHNMITKVVFIVILLIFQTGLFLGLNMIYKANNVERSSAQAVEFSLKEKSIELFQGKQSLNMCMVDLDIQQGVK